jgi:hypothetical protein
MGGRGMSAAVPGIPVPGGMGGTGASKLPLLQERTTLEKRITRRTLIKGTVGAAALAGLGWTGLQPQSAARASGAQPRASAWVWQFAGDADGSAEAIRNNLAGRGIGVIVKTHDGTSWMKRWDKTAESVGGPQDVARLAQFFHEAGIPFHAWCVITGLDPIGEAQMAAQVLAAGAESLYLDLEPREANTFWQGTPQSALAYGQALRQQQPHASVILAPDMRPWQARAVPTAELAPFCSGMAPQAYWRRYNSPANYRLLRDHGFQVDGQTTPELFIEVSQRTFAGYGLPVHPIGEADASPDEVRRFIDTAAAYGMGHVSVWRYGVAQAGVWDVLTQPPPPPAPAQPQPTPRSEHQGLTVTEPPAPEPAPVTPSPDQEAALDTASPASDSEAARSTAFDLKPVQSNDAWWQRARELLGSR